MLGTGARYAEYGITGRFFLFTQALILGLAFPDVLLSAAYSFGVLLTASDIEIPEAARPVIQSLLVALALLGVFVIGLVFEIIGSVFTVLYEANVFSKAPRNESVVCEICRSRTAGLCAGLQALSRTGGYLGAV